MELVSQQPPRQSTAALPSDPRSRTRKSTLSSPVSAREPAFRSHNTDSDPVLLEEWDLPARIPSVVDARERVCVCAQRAALGPDAIEQVRLAVGEAFVNAVRHGAPTPDSRVRLRVLVDAGEFIVEVHDSGPGFQPDQVPIPVPEELRSDGRGIYFMRLAMDDVEFFFQRGTMVRLIKRLPRAGS